MATKKPAKKTTMKDLKPKRSSARSVKGGGLLSRVRESLPTDGRSLPVDPRGRH